MTFNIIVEIGLIIAYLIIFIVWCVILYDNGKKKRLKQIIYDTPTTMTIADPSSQKNYTTLTLNDMAKAIAEIKADSNKLIKEMWVSNIMDMGRIIQLLSNRESEMGQINSLFGIPVYIDNLGIISTGHIKVILNDGDFIYFKMFQDDNDGGDKIG